MFVVLEINITWIESFIILYRQPEIAARRSHLAIRFSLPPPGRPTREDTAL